MEKARAVIVGRGDGLLASLASEIARDHALTLAARSGGKMLDVAEGTRAETVLPDATDDVAVKALLDALPQPQPQQVAFFNPSSRVRPWVERF
ncbi:MAG: hypothetical protein HKP35_11730 [Silicimonas sp.]|nr:hypothetical protein [Silicimonas sp.]